MYAQMWSLCRRHRLAVAMIGTLAVIAIVGIYLAWRHHDLDRLQLALGVGKVPLHDFRYFFYPMGEQVLTDPTPLDGFLYSPMAALFFIGFGALPYGISCWLWGATLVLLAAVIAVEAAWPARRHLGLMLLAVALTASSVPILHNMKFGQVSFLLVALVLVGTHLYERGHVYLAAFCFTFAAVFKFYPVVFLLYFVFRRDSRFLLAGLGFLLLFLLGLPFVALGVEETIAFYANILDQISTHFGGHIGDNNSQSFGSLSYRLMVRWKLDAGVWQPVLSGCRYTICAVFLLVGYRLARSRELDATRWGILWMCAMTPFFVATSWPHYFCYLPAVVVAPLAWLISNRAAAGMIGYVIVACCVGAAALSNMVVFDWIDDRHWYSWWGCLFIANMLGAIALALTLLVRRDSMNPRRPRSSRPVANAPEIGDDG